MPQAYALFDALRRRRVDRLDVVENREAHRLSVFGVGVRPLREQLDRRMPSWLG